MAGRLPPEDRIAIAATRGSEDALNKASDVPVACRSRRNGLLGDRWFVTMRRPRSRTWILPDATSVQVARGGKARVVKLVDTADLKSAGA